MSARAGLSARLAERGIARRVGVATLGAGRARKATSGAGSDIQVRIASHPGLAGWHASTHPSHARHRKRLRLPMVEDEFPFVIVVAPLVDFDTPFFDFAGDSRNAARHARALHLLPPVSLEASQSTGAWLR